MDIVWWFNKLQGLYLTFRYFMGHLCKGDGFTVANAWKIEMTVNEKGRNLSWLDFAPGIGIGIGIGICAMVANA